MTIQKIDKIVIFKTDNAYIAQIRNDSIITPNLDNDISEVLEEYQENTVALFNKKEGKDILPSYQKQDYKIKLELGMKPIKQPIYPFSLENLKVLRIYLNESRRKGFI